MYPQPSKQAAAYAYEKFEIIEFTIGTEAADTINVAMVFKDARGNALQAPVHARLYLSGAADGSTLTGTATTSALAVGTNGVILATPTSGKVIDVITNADGELDINIIQTATPTYYLVVCLPDGSIVVSDAITFA